MRTTRPAFVEDWSSFAKCKNQLSSFSVRTRDSFSWGACLDPPTQQPLTHPLHRPYHHQASLFQLPPYFLRHNYQTYEMTKDQVLNVCSSYNICTSIVHLHMMISMYSINCKCCTLGILNSQKILIIEF